jgi:hypothetical protein
MGSLGTLAHRSEDGCVDGGYPVLPGPLFPSWELGSACPDCLPEMMRTGSGEMRKTLSKGV